MNPTTPPIPEGYKLYDGHSDWAFIPSAKFWSRAISDWGQVEKNGVLGASAEPGIAIIVPIEPELRLPPPPTDPKGEAGKAKCPMQLLPPFALAQTAWVHGLGAEKYGAWNWRRNQVEAMTYVGAILRHLAAWTDGQDNDPESGRSHLAHIAASCNILMDAQNARQMVDNRLGTIHSP